MTAWERRCLWKRFKHTLEVPLEWFGIGLGVLLLTYLPHRRMIGVCDGLSAIFYWCDRRGRKRSLENLRIILGEHQIPAHWEQLIIRRAYRNMSRTIGHIFWTIHDASRRVASVGEMDAAARQFLKAHRPAVTVSAHLGCWEILSQLAWLEGHTMMSVAKDIGTNGMTRMLMRARRSIGQEIVPADGAFRPLLKGVKDGKSLGLLVDQVVKAKHGGIWVRFMGRPMPVSAAPAFFAAKCKVPVIIAWSRPLKDGRYRCETIKTYSPDAARDIWGFTQTCMHELEKVIRRHPSCWVLNYNYFRSHIQAPELAELTKREQLS